METVRNIANGMSYRAIQAKEVRNLLPAATVSTPVATGNQKPQTGNSLPPEAVEQSEHDRGLERAIARLQANIEKSPEAQGLQQALEKLQSRVQGSIETSA